MPHPPGNDSAFLIYRGFTMSKKRNKTSAHNKYFILTGKKSKLMHIPAISSITTRLGSFPQICSTIPEDQVPNKVITIVINKENQIGGKLPAQARYQQIQQAMAAIVPPPFI